MTAQQRAAANPSVSAWVSASAGTGKTHVLMSRVLRLLLTGTPPDKLLCLTFTKAAAAEMANRINRTLAKWAALPGNKLDQAIVALDTPVNDETRARARRLFAEVLDVPGGLKIQTIHSFCQFLLARFPLEAGVPPHFTVLDERTTAEALKSATETMLIRAGLDDRGRLARALDRIARRLTENSFAELMAELVRERGALNRLRQDIRTAEGVGVAVRRVLNLRPGETLSDILADYTDDGALNAGGLARAASALIDGGTAKDQDRGQVLAGWLSSSSEDRVAQLDAYRAIFLTSKDEPRKSQMTKGAKALFDAGPDVMMAEAERLRTLRERERAMEVAENTDAALATGFSLLDLFDQDKRRRAVVDFDDLILETLDLLTRAGLAPWVLYKLDHGIDHILIDEAQDTNPEQWDVVRALADEFFAGIGARDRVRTVFAVGDVKQSIYSFQRADPRAFIASREHFSGQARGAEHGFESVSLDRSFRSAPAVLAMVDAVFANDALLAGLLEDRALYHQPHRQGAGGLVELWPPEQPPVVEEEYGWVMPLSARRELDAPAKLAVRIAETIAGWLRDGEVLESGGRAVRPGDIMVLVRRRGEFDAHLISALKARGVPVAGSDRMVVTEQLAVMDLMAAGRFALLPDDDLTLATVLKGPLLGLSEDRLFELSYGRDRESLWKTLQRRRAENPDFVRCHENLTAWLSKADYMPPFEFFTALLVDADSQGTSGRERLVARLGTEANDPIDEFLSLSLSFEQAHTPSLEAFLHWLEAAPAAIKRDMEQGRDEVRIMTVHGAKGLQAPIVFMPDTCQMPDRGPRLLWVDDPLPPQKSLMLWPGKSENEVGPCADARTLYNRRRDEEYLRLLYVALTRAEDRLYVCGWDTTRTRPEGCWFNLIAAAMERMEGVVTVESAAGDILRFLTPQTAPVTPREEAVPSTGGQSLPGWARAPRPEEPSPPRPLAPSAPMEAEPAVRSPLVAAARNRDDKRRFARGRLVHALLERLPELAPEARADAARRFLSAPVHDLDASAVEALIRETFSVLDHPDFAPLFGPGSRAEVPLAGVVGKTPIAGFVDRLALTDTQVLVIDYKTNRPPPQSPDQVPRAYVRQMAAYRRLLRDVYPDREVVCALLWTDDVRLMTIGKDQLDRIDF